MNPEELKAHRRAICDALIEGKQCQVTVCGSWVDQHPQTVACRLFSDPALSEDVRIKPEPRKCWVAWSEKGSFWCASVEMKKREVENNYPHITIRWQEVVEDLK